MNGNIFYFARSLGIVILSLMIGCSRIPEGGLIDQQPGISGTPGPTSSPDPPIPTTHAESLINPPAELTDACGGDAQNLALRHDVDLALAGIETCYEIEFFLGVDNSFFGKQRITFFNNKNKPLEEIVLRTYANSSEIYGGELVITNVLLNGNPMEIISLLDDGTAHLLSLPEPLLPMDTISFYLEFFGKTPINFSPGNGYGIYNYDDHTGIMAVANGYPILAEWEHGDWQYSPVIGLGDAVVSETALYKVSIYTPAENQVISTGKIISRQSSGDSAIVEIVSGPSRDFIFITGPMLIRQGANIAGVDIVHWGTNDRSWDDALRISRQSVSLYDDLFGFFPYNELDLVSIPLRYASGVEYPGLIIIEEELYTNPKDVFFKIVISHEIAHQWWYSVVGNDVIDEPWQDEALSTYASLLYLRTYDKSHYPETLSYYKSRVLSFEKKYGEKAIGLPVSEYQDLDSAYSTLVYLKGALLFSDIHQAIGDQAFYSALKKYYASSTNQIKSPEVILKQFTLECDCDLSHIYSHYGVP